MKLDKDGQTKIAIIGVAISCWIMILLQIGNFIYYSKINYQQRQIMKYNEEMKNPYTRAMRGW